MPSYYEFFAGGGMARAGLHGWTCLFANDFDRKKARSYADNYKEGPEPVCKDVAKIEPSELPGQADLAWASFPCQDLSLAGNGLGLKGERSGAFWSFWSLMKALRTEGRAPKLIALENVCGALTSHGGRDFAAIGAALAEAGYLFGALVMDAKHFVPQSRPRLFMVAVDKTIDASAFVADCSKGSPWRTPALERAVDGLDESTRSNWRWWRLPSAPKRNEDLADIVQDQPEGVEWHSEFETKYLLSLMTPVNRAKIADAAASGERRVGGIYRRVRPDEEGVKRQRAEVRFDGIAGCLRTPTGGSSRQTVIVVKGDEIKTRLLSPREAADLMGLPDTYVLPAKYNEAYHLLGDGVAAPVVKFLAENLLEPILLQSTGRVAKAA